MHQERAGHPWLDHESPVAEVEDGVLGAAGEAVDATTGELLQELRAGNAAEDVDVTELGRNDRSPDDVLQVADDRFDFGQFRHTER